MSSPSSRLTRLDRFYRQYLQSENAARFMAQTSSVYTNATLAAIAERGSRVSRRAAALALGMLGDFGCNSTLGRALHDRDRAVRMIAENGLRDIWMRDGNAEQQLELFVIGRLIHDERFTEARDRASELIRGAPSIAEAWNQRAIAHYSLEQIRASSRDCHQALELNPYHFPAAIGMANCYLELNNALKALACFQRALGLNPGLDAVRIQIRFLQQALEES